MSEEQERRVYYADCYWLYTYGYVSSISGRFMDGTKCTLPEGHPEINVVRCPPDCPDFKDGEGRYFYDNR